MFDLDLDQLLHQKENQYFDRKSLWHGPPERRKPRDRREVRDQIAEYVAAFANADGGTLILGAEKDGSTTGHGYPEETVEEFLKVPTIRLNPKLPPGRRQPYGGHEILIFEVESTPRAVMVIGDGFPYRVDDKVVLMGEEDINAIKQKGLIESFEACLAPAGAVGDLDEGLIRRAAENAGFGSLSTQDYLLRRRLADRRGNAILLRQAAVLLFAKRPEIIDHPNAQVRILQVKGIERHSGAKGSPGELPRIEGNLPTVIEEAKRLLSGLIRKSAKLHDLFFKETPEYPEFAWQEALVNAVAHRDYGNQGRAVEIWLYDDRMEVVNPGGLPPSVSLDEILARKGVHASRNPRVTRVLAELGYMREQGEGLPRMFEEMEKSWLPLPGIQSSANNFTITLLNTPILEAGDPDWAAKVREMPELNIRQKRILVARAGQRFTNSDYQVLNGIDRDLAYRDMQQLVKLKLAMFLGGKGRAARYEIPARLMRPPARRRADPNGIGSENQLHLIDHFKKSDTLTNADVRKLLGVERLSAGRALAVLCKNGVLQLNGKGRGCHYVRGPKWEEWSQRSAK